MFTFKNVVKEYDQVTVPEINDSKESNEKIKLY